MYWWISSTNIVGKLPYGFIGLLGFSNKLRAT